MSSTSRRTAALSASTNAVCSPGATHRSVSGSIGPARIFRFSQEDNARASTSTSSHARRHGTGCVGIVCVSGSPSVRTTVNVPA